ncbi:MAG: dihydroxy-acid dehydratase, partial [Anaerolineae bacterium]|nr:dihydroxy-acid dehydratase [Anaerolineae bacterium]
MPPMIIESGSNPYHNEVQGKANEPITVAALLDRAALRLGLGPVKHSLSEIVERLDRNAPRVAVIGGSADHPAHIVDLDTVFWAATRIWKLGGVPFYFGLPVLCDGTAQSHTGMSYSLHSRNLAAETAINQMEAHAYHAAFVVSGCDKTPLGIASGLALLDRTRQRRGDASVWAAFAPAHVLRGGAIPPDLAEALDALAVEAERQGYDDIAQDLRAAMRTILQCISNAAFQGILARARQIGLMEEKEHKAIENVLAAHTCHAQGGICAFNGTGNSTRHVLSALGLAHPALDLLPKPAMAAQIERAVDDLFALFNRPAYSVGEIVRRNWANAVRIHSATGGSTNLMMHLVALMLYAGVEVSVGDIDRIRRSPPVPDLFDYSLSEGRD